MEAVRTHCYAIYLFGILSSKADLNARYFLVQR